MGLSQSKAGSIIRLVRPGALNSETERSGTSRGPPQLDAVQPESSPDSTSSPYPIIGNRKSHIYHRPDCPNYSQVAPHNRVAFNSAAAAQWSDATINRHFAFLRHVLMLAVKDGKLTQNPVSGLKFFPEVKRTRFLSGDELVRLRGVMQQGDWKLVALAIETGLRRGEQFRLRWDQVDLENGVLTLPLPKGGKTRHVPLSEEAKAILRSFDSFLRSAWVFPGLKEVTQPMDSRAFLRRSFEPGLRQAGITGACWHSLRHTAASRRVMAGVDLVSVKEILGHRDIQTTLRYAHLAPGHLRDAVNRGSLSGTVPKTVTAKDEKWGGEMQPIDLMVRPEGLEPPTPRSVVWCSIH